MSDLIDRQAAIDACRESYEPILDFTSNGHTIADSFEDILNALPSAEPQIVHCRDCKNLEIDSIFHDCWCNGHKVWLDHYCGYAERKTDEE